MKKSYFYYWKGKQNATIAKNKNLSHENQNHIVHTYINIMNSTRERAFFLGVPVL